MFTPFSSACGYSVTTHWIECSWHVVFHSGSLKQQSSHLGKKQFCCYWLSIPEQDTFYFFSLVWYMIHCIFIKHYICYSLGFEPDQGIHVFGYSVFLWLLRISSVLLSLFIFWLCSVSLILLAMCSSPHGLLLLTFIYLFFFL